MKVDIDSIYVNGIKLFERNGARSKYYVPEIGEYVFAKTLERELNSIGMTLQEYYDKYVLGITDASQRPKCEAPGCNNEIQFKGMSLGYSRGYCSYNGHNKIVDSMRKSSRIVSEETKSKVSESLKLSYKNDPTLSTRIGDSIHRTYIDHPEKRQVQSENTKKRYGDPEERRKSSEAQKNRYKDPKERERTAEISRSSFNVYTNSESISDTPDNDKLNCTCSDYKNVDLNSIYINGIKLVEPLNNKGNWYMYYIPELDGYVPQNKLKAALRSVGMTTQEYYDKYVLGIIDPSERPRCRVPGCENEIKFLSMGLGYSREYCDCPEHQKIVYKMKRQETGDLLRQFYKDHPEKREQIGKNLAAYYENTPGAREAKSQEISSRWENPSEAMLRVLNNNSLGAKSHAYSQWEDKSIMFDSLIERCFFEMVKLSSVTTNLIRETIGIKYWNTLENKWKRYMPDFLYNNHYLVEVKPSSLVNSQEVIDKMNAAIDYCKANNLEYVMLTEKYLYEGADPYYGNFPDLKLTEDDRNKVSDILNQIRGEYRENKRRKRDEGLSDCS